VNDFLEDMVPAAIVIVGLAVILGLAMWSSSYSCAVKAEKMGFNHSWAPFQGCMIEHKPGKWIELRRYRAFDEE
jgi:hypothetical protein